MILAARYRELMDQIQVTDEMRGRILRRLREVEPVAGGRARHNTVRWLSLAACAVLLLAGALAAPRWLAPPTQPSPSQVLVQPGIVTCADAAQLSEAVGFPVEDLAALPFSVSQTTYTAYQGQMAQITYEGEENSAVFRKSQGDEDNSGDYTTYEEEQTLETGGMTVTIKGQGDLFCLALWEDGTYSYSLRLSQGMDSGVWSQLLETLEE